MKTTARLGVLALVAAGALVAAMPPRVDADDKIPRGAIRCRLSFQASYDDEAPSPSRQKQAKVTRHIEASGQSDGFLKATERGTLSYTEQEPMKAPKYSTYELTSTQSHKKTTWTSSSHDTSAPGPHPFGHRTVTETLDSVLSGPDFALVLVTTDTDALYVAQATIGIAGGVAQKVSWVEQDSKDEGETTRPPEQPKSSQGSTSLGAMIPLACTETMPALGSHEKLAPVFQLSRKELHDALGAKGSRPVEGKGSYDYEVEEDGVKWKRHAETKLTIVLRPPKYRAILEPDEPKQGGSIYQKWIPKGPDIARASMSNPEPGAVLAVRVRLEREDEPGAPVTGVGYKVTYRFRDASRNKGFCTNFPAKDAKNDGDEKLTDLRFLDRGDNAKVGKAIDKGAGFATDDAKGQLPVNVSCFDYGAWGQLTAEVEVGDDRLLATTAGKAEKTALAIPRDENGNHIADAWEEEKCLPSMPASSDDESEPEGANMGDGYTFYEEYRGFVLEDGGDRKHVRLLPNRKKLLVAPIGPDRDAYIAGVASFALISGLETHVVPEDCLRPVDKEPLPRWANFNAVAGSKDFAKPQCAIRIQPVLDAHESPANTEPVDCYDYVHNPMLPIDVKYCAIRPEYARDEVGRTIVRYRGFQADAEHVPEATKAVLAAFHTDYGKIADWMERNVDLLARRNLDFTFMHELCHAVGIVHHGCKAPGDWGPDPDTAMSSGDRFCIMRYWQMGPYSRNYLIPFNSGAWDPAAAAFDVNHHGAGTVTPDDLKKQVPWRMCTTGSKDDCRHHMKLKY